MTGQLYEEGDDGEEVGEAPDGSGDCRWTSNFGFVIAYMLENGKGRRFDVLMGG